MPTEEHFLAVSIPAELHRQADELIEEVRRADSRSLYVPDLVDLVADLMEAGLESSFMKPLEEVGVGFVGRKTARAGLNSAKKGVMMIVGQVFHRMSDDQLLYVVDFIDGMLVQRKTGEDT